MEARGGKNVAIDIQVEPGYAQDKVLCTAHTASDVSQKLVFHTKNAITGHVHDGDGNLTSGKCRSGRSLGSTLTSAPSCFTFDVSFTFEL